MRRASYEVDLSRFNEIADMVVFDVNMLCSFVLASVLQLGHTTCAIHVDSSGNCCYSPEPMGREESGSAVTMTELNGDQRRRRGVG